MDRKLLTAAALIAAFTLSLAPAGAQQVASQPDQSAHHRGGGDHHFRRGFDQRDFGFGALGAYDLRSSYDDRDWAPESGNGWWNDRPDRAYPRWVQEQRMQGACEPDRMWWSGSGWHC